MKRETFTNVMGLLEHYKALGIRDVFLDDDADDLPWSAVNEVREGGLWRFNMPISVWMMCKHESGITFQWSVDFEPKSASDSSSSMLDADRISRALDLLPAAAGKQFIDILRTSCAPKLQDQRDEHRQIAARLETGLTFIRGLAAKAESSHV